MARDWVTLASAVLEEGVKALVPGAGVAVALASQALEPEKGRLRDWRTDGAQQRTFAKSVEGFGRGRGFGEADIEDGMAAASEVLRQKGASLELIAELNLDPLVTARRVLAGDPYPQRTLGPDGREICTFAVEEFYRRFLLENRAALDRAVQRVLLRRTDALPDRVAEAVWSARPGMRVDLKLRLDRIRSDYGLVGGRDDELRALDQHLAFPDRSYVLLTGAAGMGKTALLVEWIRTLERESATAAVYHFISRQYGTASQLDLMTSLVAQAATTWGERLDSGTLGSSVPVLEAEWLRLLGSQPAVPVVIVIDGADEAEAEGWQLPWLLFPKTLPANVHLVVSAREVPGRNWPAILGIAGAAELTVGQLSPAGVADVLAKARVPVWVRQEEPVRILLERTAGDPFYLRLLVDALQKGDLASLDDLQQTPAGLDDYLEAWWSDLTDSVGDQAVEALLSYLVAAVGPITRDELISINPKDALSGFTMDAALSRIGRFVVGDPGLTGIALAHWRLQTFAERRLGGASDAFAEALVDWCQRWPEHHARYALVHLAGHLLRRATSTGDLAALGELLADEGFQRARVEEADDTVGLLDDLDRILTRLAEHPDATLPLVRAAVDVGIARDRWVRPGAVLELARAGRVGDALRRMALLGAQPVPQWQEAARLVIAWLATDEYPQSASDVLEGLDPKALWGPGGVLHGRVLARLGDHDEPELAMWFPPYHLPATSDRYIALAGLERLGGAPAHARGISGWGYEFVEGNEAGTYLAEADAPHIVAYARDEPVEGDEWLSRYIDLHASNPYTLYRNRSLLSVLAAVCCLPDPDQARRHAARLTAAAFAPSPVQFAEFAHLALVVWQVRSDSAVRPVLDALVASALEGLEKLQMSWDAADRWGHHARRLAAHAEVAHLVLGDTASAVGLIDTAMQLPVGYAGYRAPASLAVAEASAIAAPDDLERREAALDAALASAHNIQEPAFCALMTARVNTITSWWRSAPLGDLAALVEAFVHDPSGSRFSPRHRLGEAFEWRSRHDHLSTDYITALRSPQDVALELGLPVLAVTRLSADADPATVVLPDPGFAPLVAAHLAARVTASQMPAADRAHLIAAMLPVASRDVTCLDQVLGRLLCVRGGAVAEGGALIESLHRLVTREPTGAWE